MYDVYSAFTEFANLLSKVVVNFEKLRKLIPDLKLISLI